jgi:Tfp pilus assembly protein PilF
MSVSGQYDAYTAFQEGMRLLEDDNAHAAVIALEHARDLEPAKGSVREGLARAYFRTGRFGAAEQEFAAALDIEPVNDYAQFGIGLCRLRAGDRARARGHLRLATVMRPDNADYRAALERVIAIEGAGSASAVPDASAEQAETEAL